jgi:anti-sigma factor RsiW
MMNASDHIAFDVLNDFVDGRLDRQTTTDVVAHIASCPTCSDQIEQLERLVSSAGQLPRSVLPPDDLWVDLRKALDARKDVVLPTAGETAGHRPARTERPHLSRRFIAGLAAAAVILIALSSGITALVMRHAPERLAGGARIQAAPLPTRPAPAAVLPASFRQTEDEYNRTIKELKDAVDTQRGRLSPETIRTVDRSLAVVDSAIAEARDALLADPNNQMLVDLLSASYQRKLDLLRRTSELGSRT